MNVTIHRTMMSMKRFGLIVFAVCLALPVRGAAQDIPPPVDTLLKQIKAADKDLLSVSEEDGRFMRLLVLSSGSKRALEIGQPAATAPSGSDSACARPADAW